MAHLVLVALLVLARAWFGAAPPDVGAVQPTAHAIAVDRDDPAPLDVWGGDSPSGEANDDESAVLCPRVAAPALGDALTVEPRLAIRPSQCGPPLLFRPPMPSPVAMR